MSHAYLAVDHLGEELLKEGFETQTIFLLKDLTRLGDSTSLLMLKKANKKFNMNLNVRNHEETALNFTQKIIESHDHLPLLEIF